MSSKILISVIGPTAIGKTKLAIAMAKHLNTEIISADSRQFFKELRIGTAVPSEAELNAAPHHFIQHKSIFDKYSVGDFEKEAGSKLKQLFINNNYAILVGGSGLYVDAVVYGLDEFPKVDPKIRESLNKILLEKGIGQLRNQLKALDSVYYSRVDIGNPHRLIRALEICIGSGLPYSSFLRKKNIKRPFQTLTVGLKADRQIIYDRIDRRVDHMISDGLVEEAKIVHPHKRLNALQTVGYKELFKYFEGEWELEFAVSEIKKNTRRFAKRQLTWYRKNEHVIWFDHDSDEMDIIKQLDQKLSQIEQ